MIRRGLSPEPSGRGGARLLQSFVAAGLSVFLAVSGGAAQEATCLADAPRCCASSPAAVDTKTEPLRFGVQVWPSSLAQSEPSLRTLIDLRPGDLRFSLGPNWRRQPSLDEGMSDAELDRRVADGFAATPGLSRHVEVMKEIKRQIGTRQHLIVWEPPPMPGEPDFSAARASTSRMLKPQNIVLAARFHVANLKFIAGLGLDVDAVELANEPDGSWNLRIAPSDYLALVGAIRAEASRRLVRLPKIYGPGASSVAATRAFFVDPATAKSIIGAVDVVSLHVWDDKAGRDRFAEFDQLFADFARLGVKPKIAITEYGLAKPDPDAKGDAMNVTKRIANSIADTAGYPPASLRDLLRLYADHVETVLYWELQDQRWSGGLFGLLDTGGERKPIYDAYRRISILLSKSDIRAVENIAEGRIVVLRGASQSSFVLTNPGATPTDVILPLSVALPAGAVSCRAADGRMGLRLSPASVTHLSIASP